MSNESFFAAREPGRSAFEDERRVVRALGAHERMLHHYSKEYPRHFCIVAELAGAKSREDYRLAFSVVQRRNPMLQVYVEDDAQGGPYFCSSERPLEIRFPEEPNWRRVVERELWSPFPADEAPLMRVSVLHAADRATVIMTFHHAAADGLSGAYIIQDLMEALDGRTLPPLTVPPQIETVVAKALSSPVGTPPAKPARDNETAREIPGDLLRQPYEGKTSAISTISFDREFTNLARCCSKENGTTLHGAICAAVICGATAEYDQDSFRIMSPINLRAMLGLGRSDYGMLITVGGVHFSLKPRPEFWQLARQMTDGLAYARSSAGVLATMQLAEANFPAGADSKLKYGQSGALLYDAIVTNLGEVSVPTEVGSLRLEALWGPAIPGRFSNSRVFSVASLDGQLRIVESTPPQMPSILDRLRQTLVDACEDV